MIRVYDLSHHPQLGDVLTCRVYKKGQSLECIRIVANFVEQSDPIGINIFRSPEIGYQTASLEFFEFNKFIDSPHWRDSVAKQWERYGNLFESSDNS